MTRERPRGGPARWHGGERRRKSPVNGRLRFPLTVFSTFSTSTSTCRKRRAICDDELSVIDVYIVYKRDCKVTNLSSSRSKSLRMWVSNSIPTMLLIPEAIWLEEAWRRRCARPATWLRFETTQTTAEREFQNTEEEASRRQSSLCASRTRTSASRRWMKPSTSPRPNSRSCSNGPRMPTCGAPGGSLTGRRRRQPPAT